MTILELQTPETLDIYSPEFDTKNYNTPLKHQ